METRLGHRDRDDEGPIRDTQLGRRPADAPSPGTDTCGTQLGHRASAEAVRASTQLGRRAANGPPPEPAVDSTQLGHRARALPASTQLGGRGPNPAPPVTRFGPGVPPVPAWSAPTAPRRRRRGASFLGATLSAALLAAIAAYLLLWRPDPLVVDGVTVAAAEPAPSCDSTVDVVGTIRTNGNAGSVVYRWLRSDGEQTAPLTEVVPDGTTAVHLHLMWTLSGQGTYQATATLSVLEPNPTEASGGFTYACR